MTTIVQIITFLAQNHVLQKLTNIMLEPQLALNHYKESFVPHIMQILLHLISIVHVHIISFTTLPQCSNYFNTCLNFYLLYKHRILLRNYRI